VSQQLADDFSVRAEELARPPVHRPAVGRLADCRRCARSARSASTCRRASPSAT
jgi:hypothetical protein